MDEVCARIKELNKDHQAKKDALEGLYGEELQLLYRRLSRLKERRAKAELIAEREEAWETKMGRQDRANFREQKMPLGFAALEMTDDELLQVHKVKKWVESGDKRWGELLHSAGDGLDPRVERDAPTLGRGKKYFFSGETARGREKSRTTKANDAVPQAASPRTKKRESIRRRRRKRKRRRRRRRRRRRKLN